MKRKESDSRRRTNPIKDRGRGAAQESESPTAGSSPVSSLHRTVGNQAVRRLYESGEIQAKLKVSQPDDSAEREAEQVAEQIMRMSPTDPSVCSSAVRGGLPRSDTNGEANKQIKSAMSGGRPLSESTRSFFEPRFGLDFSGVRVHTGSKADEAAHSINAEAFTHEKDVVFRRGTYDPSSEQGKRLLAHELTHVVQQGVGERHSFSSGTPSESNHGPLPTGVGRVRKTVQRQQSERRTIEEEKFGGTFSDPIEKDVRVTGRSIDEWASILRESGNNWRPTVKLQAFLAASVGHDTFFQSDNYMTREKQKEVLSSIGKPGPIARANLMAALLTTKNVELRGGIATTYGAMTGYLLPPFIRGNFKLGMDRVQESDKHNISPGRIQNLLGEMSWAAGDLRELYRVGHTRVQGEYHQYVVSNRMGEVGAASENPHRKQRPEHAVANQAIGGAIGTAAIAFSQHISRGEHIQSKLPSERVSKPTGESGPTRTAGTAGQERPKTAAERSMRSTPLDPGTVDNQYVKEIESHARILAGVAKRAEAVKKRREMITSAAIDVAAAGIGAAVAGPAGAAVSTEVAKAVTVAAAKNGATIMAQSGGGGAAPTKQRYKRRFKNALDEEIETYKSDPRVVWEGSGNTRTALSGPFDNAMDEAF